MPDNYLIKKSSGEKQHYSVDKLRKSLRLSGASDEIISNIIWEVEKELSSGISTRSIFKKAFRLLRKKQHSIAARYSLKNALMELGPTGYPFEKFIGEIFKSQGFKVNTSVIVQGKCVTHEVDVVAVRKDVAIVVECKYHNTPGKICNVQIPLYIHARFNDIRSAMAVRPEYGITDFEGWVVTNTRFSGDAEQFGRCVGLHLVGWDYPRQGSLKDLVENAGLFPITAVIGLNRKQKEYLIERDIVLCRDIYQNPGLLEPLALNSRVTDRIMSELSELCSWAR